MPASSREQRRTRREQKEGLDQPTTAALVGVGMGFSSAHHGFTYQEGHGAECNAVACEYRESKPDGKDRPANGLRLSQYTCTPRGG